MPGTIEYYEGLKAGRAAGRIKVGIFSVAGFLLGMASMGWILHT